MVPAPIALPDNYLLGQATTLTSAAPGVLGNDTLNGGGIVSYGATAGVEQTDVGASTPTAQGGLIRLNADGGFSYTPVASFIGTDTFQYVLRNSGGSAAATVSLTISPLPQAVDDVFSATKNTTLNVPSAGVLANDTLFGAILVSYGASTGHEQASVGSSTPTAQGGAVTVSSVGGFSYSPVNNFNGRDTFRYVIQNGVGSSSAIVTINVQAPPGPSNFAVTSPGFFYSFDGIADPNPMLTLVQGRTYTFQIKTSDEHPFEILNAPPDSLSDNNISFGTITFAVPASPGTYRYHCSIHGFGNIINTVSP